MASSTPRPAAPAWTPDPRLRFLLPQLRRCPWWFVRATSIFTVELRYILPERLPPQDVPDLGAYLRWAAPAQRTGPGIWWASWPPLEGGLHHDPIPRDPDPEKAVRALVEAVAADWPAAVPVVVLGGEGEPSRPCPDIAERVALVLVEEGQGIRVRTAFQAALAVMDCVGRFAPREVPADERIAREMLSRGRATTPAPTAPDPRVIRRRADLR